MAEIPSPVWMIVGLFVGLFSLFLGYLKPVENSIFFKLMTFVGFAMMLFGFIKLKLKNRTKGRMIDEMRQKHMQKGHSETEVNIDDYKNNPYLRQQVMQGQGHHHTQHHQTQAVRQPQHHTVHQTAQQPQHHPVQQTAHHTTTLQVHRPQKNQNARFCHQCGVPLMKSHKFCPMCGNQV